MTMQTTITQESARKNVRQIGCHIFDTDEIMFHKKQAQILACYARMKKCADATKFNAFAYLTAENNLSHYLSQ